jgi:FkbM family methyltransferase
MPNAERLRRLHDLLQPRRTMQVVDIGANPIGGPPPYQPLVESGLCHLTGFEPQAEALASLQATQSPHETYLPYAVGDGADMVLNICNYSGWTSLLVPDETSLAVFDAWQENAAVVDHATVPTRRLDSIKEISHIDMLKIDIQGGELAVFRNGRNKLANTVAIQTEVSFVPMYKGQPSFGEIDAELRKQGFIPHHMMEVKKGIISPFRLNNDPWKAINQLVETDMIYVRDFRKLDLLDDEQLKHLCLVVHACYWSFDLAYRCVLDLERRGALAAGSEASYLAIVNETMAGG